jgi:hypothetical protein
MFLSVSVSVKWSLPNRRYEYRIFPAWWFSHASYLRNFATGRVCGEVFTSWNSSLCKSHHLPVTPSVLGQNIILTTVFSNTRFCVILAMLSSDCRWHFWGWEAKQSNKLSSGYWHQILSVLVRFLKRFFPITNLGFRRELTLTLLGTKDDMQNVFQK